MIYSISCNTPLGVLKLSSDESSLKSITFDEEETANQQWIPDVLSETKKQLNEYFSGERNQFDIPLDPEGTVFQISVWNLLKELSYGSTISYSEIARELGEPSASRAVGMANGRNPVPIIIPCHRVIGHNGKLTGYSGGLERKKWLLLHDRKFSRKEELF